MAATGRNRPSASPRRANCWTLLSGSPKDAKPLHAYANPTRFLATASPLTPWLLGAGLLFLLRGACAGLALVPVDYMHSDTSPFLYVPVPSVCVGLGGWTSLPSSGL